VKFIASTIEARWGPELPGEKVHRFYVNGSYVQTTNRINGVTQEASTNAMLYLVAFAPFLIASVRNEYNIFNQTNNLRSIYLFLVLIIFLLLMSKTSLGILASVIILLLWLKEASITKKIILISLMLLLPLIIYSSGDQEHYGQVHYVGDVLRVYLDKVTDFDEASTANRFGNTIALLKTVIQNMFIGVGRNYLDYYILKNYPEWATHNFEYKIFASNLYNFPVLCSILGIMAEYGLVIFLLVTSYFYKFIKRWKNISLKPMPIEKKKFIKTLADASIYYVLLGTVGLFFNLAWYASIFIVILFFFISSLSILEKESAKIESSN
jgi:teichuronic acid biosynthesis protein TuaE